MFFGGRRSWEHKKRVYEGVCEQKEEDICGGVLLFLGGGECVCLCENSGGYAETHTRGQRGQHDIYIIKSDWWVGECVSQKTFV